jgi:2'-5' RNA ligase
LADGARGIRSFFAVEIGEEVAARIAEAQARLKECGGAVKWVNPANLHLTLKFLGEVESAAIPGLIEATSRELAGAGAFRATLAGLGGFPSASRPRVIWAGIGEGGEGLADLAERVERACEQLGFPREKRPFSAHLTLGRVREGGGGGELGERILQEGQSEFGETGVKSVVLMESRLRREGPEYLVQARFELEGERR